MKPWQQLLLACAFALLVGSWLMHVYRAGRGTRLARARNRRGKRGEQRAAALLEAAGYHIVAEQQRSAYLVRADAREVSVALTFDFVVERDGEQLVAEVKTGTLGTQLRHADTRRQLLEYQLATGASHVLLVDPENDRITEVRFPLPVPSSAAQAPLDTRRFGAAWLVCVVVLGAIFAFAFVFARKHG
ncbi:MAG: hypothetical protein ABW321_07730 [Polyangiales bacterium]